MSPASVTGDCWNDPSADNSTSAQLCFQWPSTWNSLRSRLQTVGSSQHNFKTDLFVIWVSHFVCSIGRRCCGCLAVLALYSITYWLSEPSLIISEMVCRRIMWRLTRGLCLVWCYLTSMQLLDTAVVKKIAIVYHCFTVEGHRRSGAFEQFWLNSMSDYNSDWCASRAVIVILILMCVILITYRSEQKSNLGIWLIDITTEMHCIEGKSNFL